MKRWTDWNYAAEGEWQAEIVVGGFAAAGDVVDEGDDSGELRML